MPQFIAIIKTSKYERANAPVINFQLTSLEIFYPDGRDCGVPLYVSGYDEAAELLRHAGVSPRELEEKRFSFNRGKEVRIEVSAEDYVVEAMGFDPRLQ